MGDDRVWEVRFYSMADAEHSKWTLQRRMQGFEVEWLLLFTVAAENLPRHRASSKKQCCGLLPQQVVLDAVTAICSTRPRC